MAGYVDGFVCALRKRNLPAYRKISRMMGKVFKAHGALEYRECLGDDLKPKASAVLRRGVRLKPGETVVFSYITYKSRAHRDRVNKKVMADPRTMKCLKEPMPFDMKRMGWGGFKVIVDM